LLAVALRLAFSLGYWVGKPFTHDEQEYLTLSGNLAAGRGLVYDNDGREHFGRAPGYAVFLAGVRTIQDSLEAVKVAQSLLGGLGVAVMAVLAGRAAGPRAAGAAALIGAVYPPLVWMPAYILSETLYSFLTLCATVLLWRAFDRPGAYGRFLAAGLVIGITALVRPAALPFLGLAAFTLALRQHLVPAGVLVLGAAVMVAPWALWKSRESGRVILIASEGGITFWTGNHPLAIGDGDMAANPSIKLANRDLRAAHPGLTPDELEPVYYREALTFIREQPLRWLSLIPRKFFYFWFPVGPSYTLHSSLYRYSSGVAYLILLPFGLLGFVRLVRARVSASALWLLAASVVLTCLVFFPQDRYRVPAFDPVLIVCAASLASRMGDKERRNSSAVCYAKS
jgi:4-amino-4-deoxy-L-arabinose transferase-like glycosyltransferase